MLLNAKVDATQRSMFLGFAAIICLAVAAVAATDNFLWLVIPALFLVIYQFVADFRPLYFVLWALIPISTEMDLPGGFGLDFPDEPLILSLMFGYLFYVLQQGKTIRTRFLTHPLTLFLLLHLVWIMLTMITSSLFVVSFKYLLSKIWYVTVFFFLSGTLLKTGKDMKLLIKCVTVTLVLTVCYALLRHAMVGFSFKDVNKVLVPFYRNHVSYACLLALFIPYVWYMTGWYRKGTLQRNFWWFLLLLFIVGIQFSYTRAAYVALFMALGAYFVIQWKLIRPALVVMSIGLVVLIASLVQKNKYLDYAPEFDKVITQQNFDKLVEATYKMEDISTMERLYRWVAGAHMTRSHPLVGFGPGNFYNFYKSYTISNFKTYVSDNPERSSVHCYYLLLIIEQGYPGLLLFLLLLFGAMIYGERIYHSTNNYMDKRLVMASCLSIIVVATLILINDMIETDKVGSFFFMAIATIVNVDLKNQRKPSR